MDVTKLTVTFPPLCDDEEMALVLETIVKEIRTGNPTRTNTFNDTVKHPTMDGIMWGHWSLKV